MVTTTPKFSSVTKSFHVELKKRISQYFQQTGKSSTGEGKLYTKAIILLTAFALLYIHLVFFTPPNGFGNYRMCFIWWRGCYHWV